ncbi:MAG TPA: hypothetical protein VHB51_00215 [Candidatus Saccharimonadales bacterium]|nr:hypothetical protein [Candidatus Saccharimonadales bacterium]
MKRLDWDEAKNLQLKSERGVSFEDVQVALKARALLDNIAHPNQKQYPGQRLLIVNIKGYAFVEPFVEDEQKVFLKTIYPSRKFTKKYLIERRRQ